MEAGIPVDRIAALLRVKPDTVRVRSQRGGRLTIEVVLVLSGLRRSELTESGIVVIDDDDLAEAYCPAIEVVRYLVARDRRL